MQFHKLPDQLASIFNMLSLTSLLFAKLPALTCTFSIQQANAATDSSLLIIAVSLSIVILVILGAIAYVATKKRALDQLFDEFTTNQQDWLNNRLNQKSKHLLAQNLALIRQSTALLILQEQSLARQQLNLLDSIEAARSELGVLSGEANQDIYVNIPAEIGVLADPTLLKHVLIQLLLELKQEAPTDTIITARQSAAEGCLRLSLARREESDHRLEKRSFTRPYFTELMAFCQMVIASFGGTIEAATTPGKGVTFHLDLAAVIDGPSPQSGSSMQHANTGNDIVLSRPG